MKRNKIPLDFVTFVDPSDHRTSFSFGGRLDADGEWLTVVGGLPHNTQIRPATAAERDRLVGFLQSLDYS